MTHTPQLRDIIFPKRWLSLKVAQAMAIFSYRAADDNDRELAGRLEAQSLALAVNQLLDLGCFPTHIAEERQKVLFPLGRLLSRISGRSLSKMRLIAAARELACLLNTGVPLPLTLSILYGRQQPGKLKDTLCAIAEDVKTGTTFSEAIERHLRLRALHLAALKNAEQNNRLPYALNSLANHEEYREFLIAEKKKIKNRPIPVALFFLWYVSILLLWFVPMCADFLSDLGGSLPAPLMLALNLNDALRHKAPEILGGFIAAIVLFKLVMRISSVRCIKDGIALKMPVVGPATRTIALAQFTRATGTLLECGVPLVNALDAVKGEVDNRVASRAIAKVHEAMRKGLTFGEAMETEPLFSPVRQAIEAGNEREKKLDTTFLTLAAFEEGAAMLAIQRMFRVVLLLICLIPSGIIILNVAALLSIQFPCGFDVI